MHNDEKPTPRIGVMICDCGGKISNVLDTAELCQQAAVIPEVVYAGHEAYPCSKDGQERIRRAIAEHQLDRLLIAGCTPRLVEKLFCEAVQTAGMGTAYLHVADVREQVAYVHAGDPLALPKAAGLIEMGVVRLATTVPAQVLTGRVVKSALVIGSSMGALTVALALAEAGMLVTLVEKYGELGGTEPELQERASQLHAEKSQATLKHPLIDVLFNAHLTQVSGHPGDYEVHIQHGDQTTTYAIGAIIAENAARHKVLEISPIRKTIQWFDRSRVKTQTEFEAELQRAAQSGQKLALRDIVMILCAEETQRQRCSRVCCNIGIQQAMHAKQLNPDANVTILFRDLYLGGAGGGEADLVQARKMGVTFFRYRSQHPPVISDETIDVHDTLTDEPIRVPFDRVVLTMPLVPQEGVKSLAALLGLPRDEEGFLAEPRRRLRPGRYADAGIFILGSAQQPADTAEALFQAYLTTARVERFLSQEKINLGTPTASIDHGVCTGCGNCSQVCPTQAIRMTRREGVLSLSQVDALRCIGCGNCVVVCPSKAITLPGWDDVEIPAQIEAALQFHQNGKPKVVALACEWSAYGAADMAGVRRIPYPANVRILRMNCSARFDPYHILWAFINGADGVFLGACPPGECHYGTGNLYARERVEKLKAELKAHGVDPRRLRLEFLTVDDGTKFARKITEFVDEISGLADR